MRIHKLKLWSPPRSKGLEWHGKFASSVLMSYSLPKRTLARKVNRVVAIECACICTCMITSIIIALVPHTIQSTSCCWNIFFIHKFQINYWKSKFGIGNLLLQYSDLHIHADWFQEGCICAGDRQQIVRYDNLLAIHSFSPDTKVKGKLVYLVVISSVLDIHTGPKTGRQESIRSIQASLSVYISHEH